MDKNSSEMKKQNKKKFVGYETLWAVTVKLSLPLASAVFLLRWLFNPEDGGNIFPLNLDLSPNLNTSEYRALGKQKLFLAESV
jgi:hypothetical protein